MTERVELKTPDGVTLEARWDRPTDPSGVVVFCHPHPLQGGTMMAPLMVAVTTRLVERGFSVLRFNFRGTGNSSGHHDYGSAEKLDLDSAASAARESGLRLHLAGWSFGAGVALNWLAGQEEPIPYAGIAPSARSLPTAVPAGPKRLIVGSRDQVVDVDELREYAEAQQIDLVITPGDHFFHGRGKKIGELVAQGLEA